MKLKKFFTFFFLSIALCNVINSQQITFQKSYFTLDQGTLFVPYEVVQTPDKGYFAGNRSLLMKTDSLGNEEWMRLTPPFQSIYSLNFFSVDKTYDYGYVSAGSLALIKLDSTFSIVWSKQLLNINSFLVYTIRETQDKGFILGGRIDYVSLQDARFLLIKTDSLGNVQWSSSYNTLKADEFNFLALAPDNGYVLCGIKNDFSGLSLDEIIIMKIDSAGNSQWAKRHTTSNSNTWTYHITSTSDSGYALCGFRDAHRFILKIDSSGNVLWKKKYESPVIGDAKWIEETNDGGLIMTGNLQGAANVGTLLIKTDNLGNVEWARTYDGWASCVKQTADGGYMAASRTADTSGNLSAAFYFIKTDSLGHTNGCLESTPVITVTNLNDSVINETVTDSILNVTTSPITLTDSLLTGGMTYCPPLSTTELKNGAFQISLYPNPATTHITLQYHLTQPATLQIHDITGRRVKQATLSKTTTSATIDVRTLPTGMYFYSVQGANGEVEAGKFIKQ